MEETILQDPDFLLYMYGPEGSVEPRFTDDVMAGLVADFDIPETAVSGVQVALEFACRAYWTQTWRPEIRSKDVREELAALSKAAADLTERISRTSQETWDMLFESGRRQRLDTIPTPRLSNDGAARQDPSRAILHLHIESDGGQTALEFSEWLGGIDALKACADRAAELTGAGKPGKPPDHAGFFLIHGAYAVWTATLGREFRIAWSDGGDWLTPAARFCFKVAQTVDPDIAASRIRTAARAVHEESKNRQ